MSSMDPLSPSALYEKIIKIEAQVQSLQALFQSQAMTSAAMGTSPASTPESSSAVSALERELQALKQAMERMQQGAMAGGSSDATVRQVLDQLRRGKAIPTLDDLNQALDALIEKKVPGLLQNVVRDWIARLDLAGALEKIYPNLSVAMIEDKIAKAVLPQIQRELDIKSVASAIAAKVLETFKPDELKSMIAEKLAAKLAEQIKFGGSRY